MAIVRTVRGDIDPSQLGATDAHEHLFFVSPLQPGDDMADLARSTEEARALVAAGAKAMVDWTPLGLGRWPEGLLRISEQTGLQVVAATGAHRDAHYEPGHPLRELGASSLAQRFIGDITGPGVRSGVIKVGASYYRLQPFEQKAFAAAAEAQQATGVPICAHTEHGTMGLGIVQHLARLGVPPSKVVLSHLDRNPDPGEHAETAAAGARLHCPPADLGPGRPGLGPAVAGGRGHGPRLEDAGLRRRPRPRLRVRPFQAQAGTRAGPRARGPHLRSQPCPGLWLRAGLSPPSANPSSPARRARPAWARLASAAALASAANSTPGQDRPAAATDRTYSAKPGSAKTTLPRPDGTTTPLAMRRART